MHRVKRVEELDDLSVDKNRLTSYSFHLFSRIDASYKKYIHVNVHKLSLTFISFNERYRFTWYFYFFSNVSIETGRSTDAASASLLI